MSIMDEWLRKAKAESTAKKKAERESRPKGQKCSTCVFYRGHEFSNKYHYCRLGRSNHTPNGYAKTTAGGWCSKWDVKP